jgi:hypothetical protein
VSDAAADAASRAKETMSDATDQVNEPAYRVKDTTERLKDTAAAAGAAFGDTVSNTYDRAAAGAGRTASAVARSASGLGNTALASGRDFMDFCRDQPLVLAGIGLAVGAAIGAVLPRTKAEDQFMARPVTSSRSRLRNWRDGNSRRRKRSVSTPMTRPRRRQSAKV